MFEKCIGQDGVKKTLEFHVEAYKATKVLSPLLFFAERGIGKTMFSRQLGKELGKDLVEINGAAIKSDKQFVHQIIEELKNKDVTLFIDEVHAVPWSVTALLLSMLNETDGTNKGTIYYDDEYIEIDYTKLSLITATTQLHRVFADLKDRLTLIAFTDYKQEEVAQILNKWADIPMDDALLMECATYCRGNGRNAKELGKTINKYCQINNLNAFTSFHFPILLDKISLFPAGLNQHEITTLHRIKDSKGGITLTALAARNGFDMAAQKSAETYLLRMGLMEVEGKRRLTAQGRAYLEDLKLWEEQVAQKVAKTNQS